MPQDIVLLTAALMVLLNGAGLAISFAVAGSPSSTSTGQPLTDRATLRGRLPLIGLNLFALTAVSLTAIHFLRGIFAWDIPVWYVAALQLLAISIADDSFFYFYHRWLHLNRTVYRRVHRIHHRAHAPVPIEYIYVHPLEWIGGSTGPTLGFALLYLSTGDLNAWVFLGYSAYRTIHELSIHGGRTSRLGSWLWGYGTPAHHGFHHSRPNDGNYAATYVVWDRIMGTEVTEATPPTQSG